MTLADLKVNYYQKKKPFIGFVLIPDKNQLWITEGEKHGAKKEMVQNINQSVR